MATEEYQVSWRRGTPVPGIEEAWQAPNRAQGFRTYFTEEGIRVVPRTGEDPAWTWGLELAAIDGNGGSPSGVPSVRHTGVTANRVEYDREWITEWYINSPEGLEQGFTLLSPPAEGGSADPISGTRDPELSLYFGLTGTLHPRFASDGQAVDLFDAAGIHRLRYAKLKVIDAAGRVLPSRFEGWAGAPNSGLRALNFNGGIRIAIDAKDALYPVTVDPLATSPAWEVEADGADSVMGSSVCTAGDVNGDLISDLIVGAPRYDGGQADEGKVFVFFGSPSGPSTTPDWTAESDQANARLGASVSTAGDVNGDGYSDILVGAPRYMATLSQQGAAFVWLGSASGLGTAGTPANADWAAYGPHVDAFFGISVAAVGDENGDLYGDIAVGASWYSNPENREGAVFFFRGSASGPSSSPDWQAESNQALAQMGYSVAGAGDVNGDGYADLLVGARLYDGGNADEGAAFLWFGQYLASDPDGTPANADWTTELDQDLAEFGTSVATAGDINGDGYADILVGAPGYANPDAGEGGLFLYLGSAAGPSAAYDWKGESNQAGAALGTSVFTAGDLDGDGHADVVAGAPSYDGATGDEGAAFAWFGGSDDLGADGTPANADWAVYGSQGGESLGCAVSTAGDANGDGWADLLVGADGYDGAAGAEAGRARLFLGGPGFMQSVGERWSWSASGVPALAGADVNGDGFGDLLMGDPAWDDPPGGSCLEVACTDAGRLLVFYGTADGLPAAPDLVIQGTATKETLGYAVASIGDVNGDGYDDIAAAAYADGSVNGYEDGRVFVYHGSATGPAATPSWTARGTQSQCYFGRALAGAGDVNGDGYADLLVGAPYYDELSADLGLACLFLGSPTGLNAGGTRATGTPANADWLVRGTEGGTNLGCDVSSAGDLDGDGFSDIVVGASAYDNGQNNEGGAFVWYGGLGGPGGDGTPGGADWHAEADQANANLGAGVGSAGDVNGDGYADLIVGAYYYDHGQNNEGAAFLWYGGPSGLGDPGTPANADWTYETDHASDKIGKRVGTAGDVNGDGYADLFVTSEEYGSFLDGIVLLFSGSPSGPAATPDWSYTAGLSFQFVGRAVGSADVNGDGRSDLFFNRDDSAWLVHGGGKKGMAVAYRQRREDDSGPLARLNSLEGTGAVRLAMRGRSPFGRAPLQMRWEIKPLGTPFDGTGTYGTAWNNSGTDGYDFNKRVDSLADGAAYHWRARIRYRTGATPFASAGPWMTPPWDGWNEQDFKEPADGDGDGVVDPRDTCPFVSNPGQTLGSMGDRVWLDADADGVQDAGETGKAGVSVYLVDDAYAYLTQAVTNAAGQYTFGGLCPGEYHLYFVEPLFHVFTAAGQGGDGALDSDADPMTGEAAFTLGDGEVRTDLDAGLLAGCTAPDEHVWIYRMTWVNPECTLHFQDPNQPAEVTGYDIYRSTDPGLPRESWTRVGSNVVDMDEATPNKQWTDTEAGTGNWYYKITPVHAPCGTEGPF